VEHFVSSPQLLAAHENLEVVTLRHGEVEFKVLRAVEPALHLTHEETEALRDDRDRTVAIAKRLLWWFGGAVVINQTLRLVQSWDTVETLLQSKELAFDSIAIEFQEARIEPIVFLNHEVGSGIVPPTWTIRLNKIASVANTTAQVIEPTDCLIKVWCSPTVVKLSPEFCQPFGHDLIVEG